MTTIEVIKRPDRAYLHRLVLAQEGDTEMIVDALLAEWTGAEVITLTEDDVTAPYWELWVKDEIDNPQDGVTYRRWVEAEWRIDD